MKLLLNLLLLSIFLLTPFQYLKSQSNVKMNSEDVTKLLEKAIDEDQSLRASFRKLMAKENFQTLSEFPVLISKIKQNDAKNQQLVSDIFEKYGWPDAQETSKKSVEAMFYIIQHSNVSIMQKYIENIRGSTKKGDIEKSKLAMMEDRILVFLNKPQKYGTQPKPIVNNSVTKEIWPIDDFDNLDQRRKEMNLEPFDKFLNAHSYTYHIIDDN